MRPAASCLCVANLHIKSIVHRQAQQTVASRRSALSCCAFVSVGRPCERLRLGPSLCSRPQISTVGPSSCPAGRMWSVVRPLPLLLLVLVLLGEGPSLCHGTQYTATVRGIVKCCGQGIGGAVGGGGAFRNDRANALVRRLIPVTTYEPHSL